MTTIFAGAFLVFQVQPIVARFILPWFGGTPAVWTVTMLFFQVMLLAGYAYTHYLVGRLGLRRQLLVHPVLLLLSLLLLPITPDAAWKPAGTGDPTAQILLLLGVTVAVPYLLAASTAPLMQAWFTGAFPNRSPYGLYAVSNAGSLLGLLSYPLLVEPWLGAREQTYAWSGAYVLFVAASLACAGLVWRRGTTDPGLHARHDDDGERRDGHWLLWLGLSACGVVMLLAATNQMCQDVAVVPMLWILPLTLYLLSYILTFGVPWLYYRPFWGALLVASTAAVVYLMHQDYADEEVPLLLQIAIYSMTVFSSCMVCHGELFRLRPGSSRLTFYYLMLSAGGALGGVFVSLLAPLLFLGYWEYHAALLATAFLFGFCALRSMWHWVGRVQRVGLLSAWLIAMGILAIALLGHIETQQDESIATRRGFFGVLRVYELDIGQRSHRRVLYHGRISHGRQYLEPRYQGRTTSYYGPNSGVGRTLAARQQLQAREGSQRALRFGVVGLGTGTLAAYTRPQDLMRFYEINPDVEDIASEYFSFLRLAAGGVDVALGDARIVMERELRAGRPQSYDVLTIDAFSGDAIPVHLLTREALELYVEHLAPGGAIAFHISNLYLDLRPVVLGLAREGNFGLLILEDGGKGGGQSSSTWAILSANEALLASLRPHAERWPRRRSGAILWTDDYANVLDLL